MKKLLLLLLLLPHVVSAQYYKQGNTCTKYSDSIQPLELGAEASLVHFDKKNDTQVKVNFDWPEASTLDPISDIVLAEKLKELGKCEMEHFIGTKTRGKKQRNQLKQNYTVLEQKLYSTSNDIKIGILKAVTGDTYRIYSNTLIIADGATIHSFTDFGEANFNITLLGAVRKAANYILIGEEEANQGSLYFGKFAIYFTPDQRVFAYEKQAHY